MTLIHVDFLNQDYDVSMLSDDVAYLWRCGETEHEHTIECLWIFHNCDASVEPVDNHWTSTAVGWKMTGVTLHTLVSSRPLHIEASIYWPACCGMHGFIRDGKYLAV